MQLYGVFYCGLCMEFGWKVDFEQYVFYDVVVEWLFEFEVFVVKGYVVIVLGWS